MPGWARQLEARLLTGRTLPADRFWADPALLLPDAGMPPRPLAGETTPPVLLQEAASLFQAGREEPGRSSLALQVALLEPSLVLLLSPTLRQSGEPFRDKVMRLYEALDRPVKAAQETALTLTLTNGSRVISLPGNEGASAASPACPCW
jgi:hypothetical protein